MSVAAPEPAALAIDGTRENRFCSYELRTTDIDGARIFYTEVLGQRVFNGGIGLGPLPAPAIARGAVPHWLGHIRVDDVDAMTQRFIAHGGTQLARSSGTRPASAFPAGETAVLRDPAGAVLALSTSVASPGADRVSWHVLHAQDEHVAATVYSDLFGWRLCDPGEPEAFEGHRAFGWSPSTPPAGIIANSARLPGVHAHWLFFFATDDLDRALDVVRAHGGQTLPVITAYGQRLTPCEDAQGAAFGLSQRIDRHRG